jgi:hypothetical protein
MLDVFYGHLEYCSDIWGILWPFGTFGVYLVHFIRFWYHVPRNIWQPCTNLLNTNNKSLETVFALQLHEHIHRSWMNSTVQTQRFRKLYLDYQTVLIPLLILWNYFPHIKKENNIANYRHNKDQHCQVLSPQKLTSGVNVMITSFSDFCQFSAKIFALFLKTIVMIQFVLNWAIFFSPNFSYIIF